MHKLLVPEGSSCGGKRIYKCCHDVSFRGVLSEPKVIVDVYPLTSLAEGSVCSSIISEHLSSTGAGVCVCEKVLSFLLQSGRVSSECCWTPGLPDNEYLTDQK